MGQIRAFASFFDLGVPARRQESRYIRTRHQMPPRRRAFRSNDFGLEPTTIPRDAKRQAEPPSRQGAHSRQNHFHCNPSRRLVEHYSRFAANNAHPRLNILPRRDFPAHAPHFYQAFVPTGTSFSYELTKDQPPIFFKATLFVQIKMLFLPPNRW